MHASAIGNDLHRETGYERMATDTIVQYAQRVHQAQPRTFGRVRRLFDAPAKS